MSQLPTSHAWAVFGHVYLSACLSSHALKVWVIITLSVQVLQHLTNTSKFGVPLPTGGSGQP